jgi:hypothetical protein
LLVATAVAGLHAVVVWMLLTTMGVLRMPTVQRSLELLSLPPQRRAAQPVTSSAPQVSMPSPAAPAVPPAIAAPEPEVGNTEPEGSNAIHPSIDWDAELARAAKDAAAADADRHFREFDFPRPPPALEKRPEFAWSRAHTHRVESMGGAMIVHLGEKCVLVFLPLPFVGCGIGHKPADGDLFKNLKDLAGREGGSVP